jgi:hypothetical protein
VSSVRSRLQKKVELLELWADGAAVPDGTKIPAGPVALRLWQCPDLGLESWGSPNAAAPGGPNADLRKRYDLVSARLRVAKEPSARGSDRVTAYEKAIAALAAQVSSLREEVEVVRDALAVAQNAELRKTIRVVAPFGQMT